MEHGSVKQDYDLNLLYVLALLLEEQSVIGVARRMKVSSATISRFLARIREAFSDRSLAAGVGRGSKDSKQTPFDART